MSADPRVLDSNRVERLRQEARMHIDDCEAVYQNEDALARRKAQAAYEDERPAYWTTASYHSQRACQLQLRVHETSLSNALRSTYHGADYIAALDTLVPLNEQAAIALVAQYSEFGSWVEVEEVLARRVRRMPRTRMLAS